MILRANLRQFHNATTESVIDEVMIVLPWVAFSIRVRSPISVGNTGVRFLPLFQFRPQDVLHRVPVLELSIVVEPVEGVYREQNIWLSALCQIHETAA